MERPFKLDNQKATLVLDAFVKGEYQKATRDLMSMLPEDKRTIFTVMKFLTQTHVKGVSMKKGVVISTPFYDFLTSEKYSDTFFESLTEILWRCWGDLQAVQQAFEKVLQDQKRVPRDVVMKAVKKKVAQIKKTAH